MIAQLTNHLLQSTAFALAAALLVAAFRRNRANVRYSLWLIASLKFLIPFSVLIGLGSQIHWAPAAHEIAARAASPDIMMKAEQFSEPFVATMPAQRQTGWRPFAIAAIWCCGFGCILYVRLRAWRGMRIAVRRSHPLGLGLPVEARLSAGIFEPGIVGLLRPVLLLPQGAVERLTPSELEAVIAHELCHVRRHDNLFAAIHMLIEALFWFHPLVWWIGAHLLEERERACDEDVISLGNRPDIYADAILNICKLYAESPLACVSGVTGADVRRRIEAIMSEQRAAGLGLAKKIILACAAIVAVAGPLSVGLLLGIGQTPRLFAQGQPVPIERKDLPPAPAPAPTPMPAPAHRTANPFETPPSTSPPPAPPGSIKPCRAEENSFNRANAGWLRANCQTVRDLVRAAYLTPAITRSVDPQQRLDVATWGGPSWVNSDRYTIELKEDVSPSGEYTRTPALRRLLESKFHLSFHYEKRDVPVYALSVASEGLRMSPFQEGSCTPADFMPPMSSGVNYCRSRAAIDGSVVAVDVQGMGIQELSQLYLRGLNRPVIDKTGLIGRFDFHLVYAQAWQNPQSGPSIVTAIRQQLGLELKPEEAPLEFLVIDRADRPTSN